MSNFSIGDVFGLGNDFDLDENVLEQFWDSESGASFTKLTKICI